MTLEGYVRALYFSGSGGLGGDCIVRNLVGGTAARRAAAATRDLCESKDDALWGLCGDYVGTMCDLCEDYVNPL